MSNSRDKKNTVIIVSHAATSEELNKFLWGSDCKIIEASSESSPKDLDSEEEHLHSLYADPDQDSNQEDQEDQDQNREAHFKALFAVLEREAPEFFNKEHSNWHAQTNFGENIQQLVHQINWRLVSVLVCNGLFISANLISSSNTVGKQFEFGISTLLPILYWLIDERNFKNVIPGAMSGFIASELNKQGAPFWAGPALTIPLAAVALTENKFSKCAPAVWEKVSNTVSNSVNHVFNFWHRGSPKPNLNLSEDNKVLEVQRPKPGKLS